MNWRNLAFPDSDASFETPANVDAAASGAVVFAQDNDASIDIDALGFTYSSNFAVELVVYSSLFVVLSGNINLGNN